ncbi:MAG: glycosyltransferase family 2 protein [Calditrichaeota bacterium]|nr:glycosyltransferase family 2 protein [Candidatus Cloacimonadota bacterium]MCA9786647.1 glycosyltransferase family 2 protein [Candidatus Cloacimonadota bacterium]MCB1045834.1 glycosyltransferase family 2 protein [Calditrichota bacterium]MCB9473822.1 glycosyltransferase family 2 protein [Candidatus Delongbacteria bacterium]
MLAETGFLLSTGILLFAYPVTWLVTRPLSVGSESPPDRDPDPAPHFTILVPAYNEEAVIRQKLQNFKELRYPPDRLDMVIVSDQSNDATDSLVRELGGDRVRLVNYGERLGKTRILNRTVPELAGEIVIQTDANVLFDPSAIRAFARWYSDPRIGLVCGYEERSVPPGGDAIRTETTYRDFEVRIKMLQSRFGAVMGAHGGLYSIRKACWQPLPDNALSNDDLLTAMNVLRQGHRVVMDSSARALEITGTRLGEEFRRRVRIGAGNYQVFWWHSWLLNPLQGWKSFFFYAHKLPRWFTPHLMLVSLACNILLADRGPGYLALLVLQLLFYGIALLGAVLDALKIQGGLLMAPWHFCSMNLAVLVGFFKWLGGIRSSTWTPGSRR